MSIIVGFKSVGKKETRGTKEHASLTLAYMHLQHKTYIIAENLIHYKNHCFDDFAVLII